MISDLNDSFLGKKVPIVENYDPSLLFKIPRSINREKYNISSENLPFVGADVWNCYEVSFLTNNGLPISRVMKLIYSANSTYLVESKSLKLYLNSFNMEKFGETIEESEEMATERIKNDLSNLIGEEVTVALFSAKDKAVKPFSKFYSYDLLQLIPPEISAKIHFEHFVENPNLLRSNLTETTQEYIFYSDVLRSNCPVTHQPDWGDVFVKMTTKHTIDFSSILQYLVSFRKETHFHEEIVEIIYKRFLEHFQPEKLMVCAMYTRRGGIDINPIRASENSLLNEDLLSMQYRVERNFR